MIKEKVNKYQKKSEEFIHKWEDISRDFILNFLEHFNQSTNMVRDRVHRAISPNPTTASSSTDRKKSSFSLFSAFNKNGKRSSNSGPSSSDAKRARPSINYQEPDSEATTDSDEFVEVKKETQQASVRQSRKRTR
jgi:hypothetical protein